MKEFKVQVYWTVGAVVSVKAESLEEAIAEVKEKKTSPQVGEYLADSFEVDEYASDMMNEQDK